MHHAWWTCARFLSPPYGHLVLHAAFSKPIWPLSTFGMLVWKLNKARTRTEMNCTTATSWHENRENPSEQKLSHFILCSAFLVPRNSKQRKGNCHNPIFIPGIFSGVGTQNEVTRTKPSRPEMVHHTQKTLKMGSRAHFPKSGEVWPRPWPDQKQDLADQPLTIE